MKPLMTSFNKNLSYYMIDPYFINMISLRGGETT